VRGMMLAQVPALAMPWHWVPEGLAQHPWREQSEAGLLQPLP